MIKRVTDINSLSGDESPLFPLIYSDFLYPYTENDGAYIQTVDDEITAVFSVKADTITFVKTGSVLVDELESFISFYGIKHILSDCNILNCSTKPVCLMTRKTEEMFINDVSILTPMSTFDEYKNIFPLLSSSGGDFDVWYCNFSRKINKNHAIGVHYSCDDQCISCAVVPYIYKNTAVIAGVFTKAEHRGKGYALRCVNSVINRCYACDIDNIYLWCEEENIDFYKKAGFSVCGQIYCEEEV